MRLSVARGQGKWTRTWQQLPQPEEVRLLQVPPLESVQILAVVRLLSVEAQPPARELAPVQVQEQELVREQPPAQTRESV